MVYALYYKNQLVYKRAVKDLSSFKSSVYNKKKTLFLRLNYTDRCRTFNKLFNKRFNYCVDGFEIRTYKNYSQVLENIVSNRITTRQRKKPVSNFFYVLDIETTNYKDKHAFTYLYGIKKYYYDYNFNDDNINKFSGKYHAFYSKSAIQDFFIFLNDINNEAEKNGVNTVIYAHNLNYELFELIQNIFPFFDLTDEEKAESVNNSIFRGSAVKPLRFQIKNLVFLDSLALTSKSLKKISENHSIKKLDELKTYKEQYFFGSELPSSELEYNEHDLDVTALGVFDSIRSLKADFETYNDFQAANVLTVTSISKFLNKHIYSDAEENARIVRQHTTRASNNLPLTDKNTISKRRLKNYQDTFQGGFTHANPFIAYNTIQNDDFIYISFDKKSHYPATMTMRKFPYFFKEIKDNKTQILKDAINENLKRIEYNNYDLFKNNMLAISGRVKDDFITRTYYAPTFTHFIAEIELRDVQIKFYNYNAMPLIPLAKTRTTISDALKSKKIILDNGKILKADRIIVKCTDIDVLSYFLMYEFKIGKCYYLEISDKVKFADNYIQQSLRYHLVNKNEISLLKDHKKTIEELTNFTGTPLFSAQTIKNYNEFTQEEKRDFINSEYTATKTCGVNNQYGINVQKIINDNISFNLNEYKFQKETDVIQGCKGKQTTRDYITGLYITAYARLDLAFMTYLIYNEIESATVCYWDTDSIKIKIQKSELETLKRLFEYYNEQINKVRNYVADLYGNLFNLGIWELDGSYKYFYTMGAKKYIVLENDAITVTNAGINKKKFSNFLTDKYNEQIKNGATPRAAFEFICNTYYHPNIILSSEITGRKTIIYPDIRAEKIKLVATDENGEKIKINQYPTALISDSDYSLSNTHGSHLINRQHFEMCRRLQLNASINFNCNISPAICGNCTHFLTDDYSDYII